MSSHIYATDGLLILGVVMMMVTVYSGIRGLHARSAAAMVQAEEEAQHRAALAAAHFADNGPNPRRAA
jgi:hypothetical protein